MAFFRFRHPISWAPAFQVHWGPQWAPEDERIEKARSNMSIYWTKYVTNPLLYRVSGEFSWWFSSCFQVILVAACLVKNCWDALVVATQYQHPLVWFWNLLTKYVSIHLCYMYLASYVCRYRYMCVDKKYYMYISLQFQTMSRFMYQPAQKRTSCVSASTASDVKQSNESRMHQQRHRRCKKHAQQGVRYLPCNQLWYDGI